MASNQTFQCPSCGAALVAQGDARQVKCPYCSTQVIVPDSLRTPQPGPPSVVVVQAPPTAPAAPARSSAGGCLVGLVFSVVILGIIGFLTFSLFQPVTSVVPNISGPLIEMSTAIAAQPSTAPTQVPTPTETPGYASIALQFGSAGTGTGFFDEARGVGADGDGNIYVSEYTSGRVQRFDPTGKFLNTWKTAGKNSVRGLAVDRAGTVYVVRAGAILKYNGADGTLLDTFKGEHDDYFDDVAVLTDGSLAAVSQHNRDDLVRLTAQGKIVSRIERAISGQSDHDQPELLTRIAVDGQGNLFALGEFNNAVFKFAPDGKFVTHFGSQGSGPGQFSAAQGIAIDNQGRVYVSDGARIQVFAPDGRYLAEIDDIGGALGLSFTSQNELLVAARDHVVKLTLNQP